MFRHAVWDASSKKIVGHYSEYPFGFTYWSGQTNDVKIREQFSITEMETWSASKSARWRNLTLSPDDMAIYDILLQLFEKAVMYFYIDIENYKLHWISIHNHYIYIHKPVLKKTHWLRIYVWKPHKVQENSPHAQVPGSAF